MTKYNIFKIINNKLYIDSSVLDFNQPVGTYSVDIALINLFTGEMVKTVSHSVEVDPSECVIPTTTEPPKPPSLSFDDYLLIFIDESSSYANAIGSATPNWSQDFVSFQSLYENNGIDLNKILIFWVWLGGGSRLPIYPTSGIENNEQMPIPLDKIILSPRNVPNITQNGQELTGSWILDQVNSKIGQLPANSRVVIFIDQSGSMRFNNVSSGVNEFLSLLSQAGYRNELILCSSERWLRWVVSTFNGNPTCS